MNGVNLAALITAIAGLVSAVGAVIGLFVVNRKVNAQTSKSPVGGSVLPPVPPTGPVSLPNCYRIVT